MTAAVGGKQSSLFVSAPPSTTRPACRNSVMTSVPIKRALISVSDKTGVAAFARALSGQGVEIFSTGGTFAHLESAGVPVADVAAYTGFPEMMNGRVKTLHPKIFAGILCRHDRNDDRDSMEQHDIASFELVVVNLYPFAETIANPGVTFAEATEQIDIGGPSLVRAAAKNSKFVTVVTSPEQYDRVAQEIMSGGATIPETRRQLMSDAFAHTAAYDATIAAFIASEVNSGETGSSEELPASVSLTLTKQADLRYGENSHQQAALYRDSLCQDANVVAATQHNGKGLSYNNLLDLDAALNIVRSFGLPACSVIKHNNPCGAAVADSLTEACQRGFAGDPVSAFGSVVGFNREVDDETANFLASGPFFVEAIVAPGFSGAALETLTTKPKWKKNVRLLSVGSLAAASPAREFRQLLGWMLVQDADNQAQDRSQWKVVTESPVDDTLMEELAFGWTMVRFVKSNAITLSKDRALVGVGAGQMSRVDSVEISIRKAGPERASGAILASDAFFPFPDSIGIAAEAGVAAIIQPGGSVKDQEVIDACNAHGIPMVFAGNRHFRH